MAKIVLVEDDPRNLKLARDLLEFAGLEVHPAMTAPDGIRLVRELKPDVVLMDIQLPGMSGLEARKILLEDPATASVPLVFVTASVTDKEKEAILATGCPMIEKPINTRTFVADVKKFIA